MGSTSKSISIDFDGVLHSYDRWRGVKPTGRPVPGAQAFCEWLLAQGYDIVVHSARLDHGAVAYQLVNEWLEYWKFPVTRMLLSLEKPRSILYIDDRAYRFRGMWEPLQALLLGGPESATRNVMPWERYDVHDASTCGGPGDCTACAVAERHTDMRTELLYEAFVENMGMAMKTAYGDQCLIRNDEGWFSDDKVRLHFTSFCRGYEIGGSSNP